MIKIGTEEQKKKEAEHATKERSRIADVLAEVSEDEDNPMGDPTPEAKG